MSKVFISYSHKDKEWVREWLMPRLEAAGHSCCIDYRDFKIGRAGVIDMEQAVETCDKTLFVLTPNWVASEWGNFEALLVQPEDPLGLKGRFLPLLLEKCNLPKRLSIYNHADFTDKDNWEKELNRLLGQMDGKEKGAADHISLSRMPVTDAAVFGREKETAMLDEAWNTGQTHVVTLIAWGGVGKTALVNHWLNRMTTEGFRGAEKVYAWSFYSQGAAEGKQASADEFMQETLRCFGDPDPTAGAAEEKGRRLAGLIRKSKTLLILDGMEPLQYPPSKDGSITGQLKDRGLRTLLKELAVSQSGLCVVTSREGVKDLSVYSEPAVKAVVLEHLSLDAGTALLKHLGVKGRDVEMTEAVWEYGGHALALRLLGNYLSIGYDGDIRKRDTIGELMEEERTGGHAKRMMQAYRHWLGESAELDILYMMGLFDRPVEEGAIKVLKKAPAIAGLTERLVGIPSVKWNYAVKRLRELGLLAKDESKRSGGLDCHPLVREYFGERLKEENAEGWREAHSRLYEYYKKLPEKELPGTLEEMGPLFSAVAHGCLAGRHQEVMDDVYHKRIRRSGKEAFIVKKLGAFGADLSALSHFFDEPWERPASGLREDFKAAVLNWSAFGLRAVGRLREAVQPMKAALEMHIEQRNWKQSAIDSNNLSELLLTLGEVSGAVAAGRESVTYADRSGDAFLKMGFRTTLADALHQWGHRDEAEGLFREAEEMQRKSQPGFHFLYSLQGFRFCDLLLERGKDREVIERAEKFFEWREPGDPLLTISLDYLIAGRAWMERALEGANTRFAPTKDSGAAVGVNLVFARNFVSEPWTNAREFLDRAVTGLREAGTQHELPRALLFRAVFYRLLGDFASAWVDLSEAHEIAEAGDMKLHLCDYHLEAARLCAAEGKESDVKEHEAKAAKLIEEMGYYRRKKEEL